MIKLNDIKVAIFDFDDTLAIHKIKNYRDIKSSTKDEEEKYYMNAYLYPNEFYDKIDPCYILPEILDFINILRDNNIKLYCVSGMKNSFNLDAKEYFINKYYGNDIKIIITKDQESKVDVSSVLAKVNKCNLSNILFVDDLLDNVIKLKNKGINAIVPNEIKGFLSKNAHIYF